MWVSGDMNLAPSNAVGVGARKGCPSASPAGEGGAGRGLVVADGSCGQGGGSSRNVEYEDGNKVLLVLYHST